MSVLGFITINTQQRIRQKQQIGQVLHLFEHTINFRLNQPFPNLMTIGSKQIKGAPNSIYVPAFSPLHSLVKEGEIVHLHENQTLVIANRVLQLHVLEEKASFIQPGQLAVTKLEEIQKTLKRGIPEHRQLATKFFFTQFLVESDLLVGALKESDWLTVKKQLPRLLGLGIGLTPTGDDFLTGLILVLNRQVPLGEKLATLIKESLALTNIISQHQLYFACQGESKPLVSQLINQLFDDSSLADFQATIKAVLAIGSTSGYDLLFGIYQGINIIEYKGEKKHEFSRKRDSKSLH